MADDFRYAQLCPLARAAELVGERWTLLVIRELLLGPQRFSDLKRRLPGVSASVLTERLERLERRGLIRRDTLPPPAASSVYELDEAGRALVPAMIELARWGMRFLHPTTASDHFEPDWLKVALTAFAARGATPACCYEIAIEVGAHSFVATVTGGPGGTQVREGPADAPDARLRMPPQVLLGLVSGALDARDVARSREAGVDGDPEALAMLPRLFEVARPLSPSDSTVERS